LRSFDNRNANEQTAITQVAASGIVVSAGFVVNPHRLVQGKGNLAHSQHAVGGVRVKGAGGIGIVVDIIPAHDVDCGTFHVDAVLKDGNVADIKAGKGTIVGIGWCGWDILALSVDDPRVRKVSSGEETASQQDQDYEYNNNESQLLLYHDILLRVR
jgi:hypothetical protein